MFNFFRKSSSPKGIPVHAIRIYDAIRSDHNAIDRETSSKIRLADTIYQTVTAALARKFVSKSSIYWSAEISDCDDQAWMAKAEAIKAQFGQPYPYAFGVLWTEDHALNWYMDENFKIRLIDQEQYSGTLTQATLWLA